MLLVAVPWFPVSFAFMAARPQNLNIPSFEEARHLVEALAAVVRAPQTEGVDLLQAAGRVLAEGVAADRDIPPFPRATRDGFAIRAADMANLPSVLNV